MEKAFHFSALTYPYILAVAGAVAIVLFVLCRVRSELLPELKFPWSGLFIKDEPRTPRTPPLWLWILLLAVAFIGIAATLPILDHESDLPVRHIILLEAGVESKALSQSGAARVDLLKDELRRYVSRQPDADEFLLITVSVEPLILDTWVGARDISKVLNSVKPSDAKADWPAALDRVDQLLGQSRGVLVLAGCQPRKQYEVWLEATALPPRECVMLRGGTGGSNVGVDAITVFRSPFLHGDLETKVYVRFRAFGTPEERNVTVTMSDGRRDKLIGKTRIPPLSEDQPAVLPIHIASRTGGLLKIELDPPDCQPADDRAYAVLATLDPLDVGILSSSDKPAQVLAPLAVAEIARVRRVSAGDLEKGPVPDVLVTDARHADMEDLPLLNTLRFGGAGRKITVTPVSLKQSHPLCRDMGDLDIARVTAWFEEVTDADVAVVASEVSFAGSPRGPLIPLIWTEKLGRCRRACFSFDPFAFRDYKQYRKLPLLMVNALEWLAPTMAMPSTVTAGNAFPLCGIGPGQLDIVRKTLAENPAPIKTIAADLNQIPGSALEKAGVYQLKRGADPICEFAVNAAVCPVLSEDGPQYEAHSYPGLSDLREDRTPRDFEWWLAGLILITTETLLFFWSSNLLSRFVRSNPLVRGLEERRIRKALAQAHLDARRNRDKYSTFSGGK